MPRSKEQNASVRESRKMQILNAALSVYVRHGYYGTDMDTVAETAHLAKGLVYYYYKTKKELFNALYLWMFDDGYSFSTALLESINSLPPIDQLMAYVYEMFAANKKNPYMMQFFIRAPFDSYAIFDPAERTAQAEKSDMHRKALTLLIRKGIEQGVIPATDPSLAANSFWTVFVANLFEYSRLILGESQLKRSQTAELREIVRFCFQGLGIDYAIWNSSLEKITAKKQEGGPYYEGL